jgi:hypothetical protein
MGVIVARRWLRFVVVTGASIAAFALASASSAFAASAPVIERVWASEVNRSTARLDAVVNPSEADTTYRFEYGPDASYGSSVPVPDGDLGAGAQGVEVSQQLTGLQPGSTYHYRIVATSSEGTVEGEDGVFNTFPAPAPPPPDTCPNAAYRVGASAGLPDCRAYEMVSPVGKNGGDISAESFGQTISSDSGDRVEFVSKTAFGEGRGSGNAGYSQYVAERQPAGWVTRSITPTPNASNGGQVFGYKTEALEFSADLGTAGLLGYDLPEGPSTARPHNENLYLEDTSTGKLFGAVTDVSNEGEPVPYPQFFVENFGLAATEQVFAKPILGGGTPSLSLVTFMSRVNFTPEAHGFAYKTYTYEKGVVKLLGVLPDGSVPPEGSQLVFGGSERGDDERAIEDKDTVSIDGSRILFEVNEFSGQIFMRKNGTESVLVTESETSEPATAENIGLEAVTPDLKHIVFRASTRLLDSAPEGGGLYMYTDSPHPESESNLTYIGNTYVGNEDAVLGISDDGTHIYYDDAYVIYLWEAGQTRQVAPEPGVAINEELRRGVQFSNARVSPDGQTATFMAKTNLTADAQVYPRSLASENGVMYVYKAAPSALRCASCQATHAVVTTGVEAGVHADENGTALSEPNRTQFMSSDGRYVFFSTAEGLVPQDTNGVVDAYEYDTVTERLSLLSTGTGGDGAWFVDASPDGRNVFLVTRQKLAGGDPDKLVDVYDVRVDGGLSELPASAVPCAGDACQGTPSAAPSFNVASGFVGLGNPAFTVPVKAKARAKPNVRLRHALAVCRKEPKRKRARCERSARKRYGLRGVSSVRNNRSGR